MNNHDLDVISLNILLGNDIYKLYEEKCNAIKYQLRLFNRNYWFTNVSFPNLDDIISKYWLKTFKNNNYVIKFDIYDIRDGIYTDGFDRQFFLLGMIDFENFNFLENNKKIFVAYEKNSNTMKFFNEKEAIILFGVKI